MVSLEEAGVNFFRGPGVLSIGVFHSCCNCLEVWVMRNAGVVMYQKTIEMEEVMTRRIELYIILVAMLVNVHQMTSVTLWGFLHFVHRS